MSVPHASAKDHTTRPRYENRPDAHAAMSKANQDYPQYKWQVRACKRLDQGGMQTGGNKHYHAVIVRMLTNDEIEHLLDKRSKERETKS